MTTQARADKWFAASLAMVGCLIAGALLIRIPFLRWFFIGFYPGSLRSGDPGFDTTMHYSLDLVWGCFMAFLDLALCVVGWKLRSIVLMATPMCLLLLTFVVSLARCLTGIPGD